MRISSYLKQSIQPVIGTIVAGGVGTIIGTYFQDRSNEIATERAHKAEQLKIANTLFEHIFENLDKALYLNKEAMYVGVGKLQNSDLKLGSASFWARYTGAVEKWKTGEQRRIAETGIYFGDEMAKEVEDLHRLFNRYERMVRHTYHGRKLSKDGLVDKKGDPNDYRTRYFDAGYRKEMDAPQREIDLKSRKVAQSMVQLLKEGKVGKYCPACEN
uniref:Uncharacterized protein n=1 Tax=Helicotheca tamesis TaxID=374047 RepID=A0A6U0GU59_9STRA|mmetsp:Transcript_2835/g.3884  ORF Transcript_2835/g.3884 Transcript_2835/m.3884 type:complete len:215 (+) Transcript_2835:71-715(+)